MSSMKVQCPPQTYSRLFRPWDMAQRNAAVGAANISQPAANVVGERAPPMVTRCTDRLSKKSNSGATIAPNTPATNTIKVEIVKVESDVPEAEDEEVDVDNDIDDEDIDNENSHNDDDNDNSDYLHTSRTSDCASSQSNCSQLSNDDAYAGRACIGNNFLESISPLRQFNSPASYTAHHEQAHADHHFPSRAAFEAYHHHQQQQQQHLHLLAHNVMSTSAASESTTPKSAPTTTTTTPLVPSAPASLSHDFVYGATTGLGRSGSEILPSASPASLMGSMPGGVAAANAAAAAAAAASFVGGMDAYTFGLMEQEYARIMAEEAHMKAMNARKQRPKKFKCPHCEVAFSNNGQLKGHIRIHTGERPFKCDVESCGKTFTRNEELTRHKRIHTGLRPYPCAACGKKFGRRDHLKKHMKTHMPQERQLGPAIFVPMYPYLYGY